MPTVSAPAVRNRVPAATALAVATHLVLDYAASRVAWTTPPYLLLEHARGPFRDLLQLDPSAILLGASIASSVVNGIVAGIFGFALEERRRRLLFLGLLLSGLWLLSGGLLALVYLSLPPGLLAGSLLAGVPRSFAVAWVVDRTLPRPSAP